MSLKNIKKRCVDEIFYKLSTDNKNVERRIQVVIRIPFYFKQDRLVVSHQGVQKRLLVQNLPSQS